MVLNVWRNLRGAMIALMIMLASVLAVAELAKLTLDPREMIIISIESVLTGGRVWA